MRTAIATALVTLWLASIAHAETIRGTLQPTVVACGEQVAEIKHVELTLEQNGAVLTTEGVAIEFGAVGSSGYLSLESPTVSDRLGVLRIKRTKRVLVTLVRIIALGDGVSSVGNCTEVLQGEFRR